MDLRRIMNSKNLPFLFTFTYVFTFIRTLFNMCKFMYDSSVCTYDDDEDDDGVLR